MMNKKGEIISVFSICVMVSLAVFIVTTFNNQTCSMSVDPTWTDEQKLQCDATNFAVELIKKVDDFSKNILTKK